MLSVMLSVEFWVVFKVVIWVVPKVPEMTKTELSELSELWNTKLYNIKQTNITPNGVFKPNYLIINTIILHSDGVTSE